MSLTGPDPDDPHPGRRADRRPARRHVRRVRRARRAARAGAHRPRAGRAHSACWPPSSACTPSRAPATPSPARCRTPRATTTPRSAPTACSSCQDGMRADRGAAARACGSSSRRVRPRPRRAGHGHQRRAGRQPRRRQRRRRRRLRRLARRPSCSPGWPRPASRRARSAPSTEVYEWDQTRSQGLVIDVDHPALGRIELPGPPLRLRRQRARRRPAPSTCPRRCSASTTRRSAPGSTRWTPTTGGGPGVSTGRRVGARELLDTGARRGQLAVAGTLPVAGGRARQPPTPPSWRRPPSKAGTDESIITGERHAAAAAGSPWWPGSSASSPGRSASRRPSGWSLAVERATREGLPLLAAPASGGTRMQEGTRRLRADGRDHRRRSRRTRRPGCPTSSTCATPRPAACSPPGGRSATSPSPSRAR